MQRPAHGKEELHAVTEAGDRLVGQQLCEKKPWDLVRQLAENEPVARPGTSFQKSSSLLSYIKRSRAGRSSGGVMLLHSLLIRLHLEYRAQFGLPNARYMLTNCSKFIKGLPR